MFANFAEAVAEGRGKAQAEFLRRTKTETIANRLVGGSVQAVSATDLRKGDRVRVSLDAVEPAAATRDLDLLALDEALTRLAAVDPTAAELVKLRYFAGLTIPQAAEALGIGARSADLARHV